jgi:hypothetical protein
MSIHLKYGKIIYDEWLPLYFHKTNKKTKEVEFGKHPNYEILFKDDIKDPITIRHKIKKNIIKSHKNKYVLAENSINKTYNICHIALASAFPKVKPKETIDHIDNNHTNNHITNLEWMTRSDNSRKGQIKAVRLSKQKGGKNGKQVIMLEPDIEEPKNRNKAIKIAMFRSTYKCAQYIIDNIIQKDKKPTVKSVGTKISKGIKFPHLRYYGYYFDKFEIDIKHEEWKVHPKNKNCEVSTHGRIRNSSNKNIYHTYKCRNKTKYTYCGYSGSVKQVHILVWETWMGINKENLEIMHDDTAPLKEDGTYRNWLCDLSLGTKHENISSFHENKYIQNDIMKTEKFTENIPKKLKILKNNTYPDNELGKLMKNPPIGIQRYNLKNKNMFYVLGRRVSKTGYDKRSSSNMNISREEKFLQILDIYKEYCIEEKQDKIYMEINTDDYRKYIPKNTTIDRKQCNSIMRNGKKCKLYVSKGKERCGIHDKITNKLIDKTTTKVNRKSKKKNDTNHIFSLSE